MNSLPGLANVSPNQSTAEELPLSALINQTRSLFHRLAAVATLVHRQADMTGGKRGVLMELARGGNRTVPEMARARPVSRQHIQSLVNLLVEDGTVEFLNNPAHKRSRLVSITPQGLTLVEAMIARERRLLSHIDVGLSNSEVEEATRALRAIRTAFENLEWTSLLEQDDGG